MGAQEPQRKAERRVGSLQLEKKENAETKKQKNRRKSEPQPKPN
jgi:hypothetical protein